MKYIGTNITRDVERNMYDYMPSEYEDIRESRAIVHAESTELENLNSEISDVLDQFFVDTATWGLANWEALCGLPTDESKPIDQRRSVIKSKLRGVGTVTVSLIKNVAESWYGGDVEVMETPAQYLITISFVSTYGVPSNLIDIENALREIIPAHLQLQFEFRYVTYEALKASYANYDAVTTIGFTYDQLITNGE